GNDLILRLLQFHHLAELGGLAGLAFADDFGRWLEHAEELAFAARIAAEYACPRLLHHLPDEWHHLIELVAQPLQRQLLHDVRRLLDALDDLRRKALCLPHHPARRIQTLAVALLQLVLIDRTPGLGARDPADLQQPELDAAAVVAQLRSHRARNLRDL